MNEKRAVLALGAVLLVVGMAGQVSSPLFGIFAANSAHNFVHVVSGVLAIAFTVRGEAGTKQFAKVFGFLYGLVAVLGLVIPGDTVLGFMAVNFADDLFHLVVAAGFLYVGYREG